MYLNLLFRALKADTQVKRVKAFVKRVIQIATFHQPSFICGVLFLLSELEGAIPSLHSLMDTPQETMDDEEEVFRDVPEEGEEKKEVEEREEKRVEYDGRKRDPSHANADRSCLWELVRLPQHTICLERNQLIDPAPVPILLSPLGRPVRFSSPRETENALETRPRHAHTHAFPRPLRVPQRERGAVAGPRLINHATACRG